MKDLSKIIIAASSGLLAGVTLGLLFAPEKGEKTRKDISKKSRELLHKVNDQVGKERLTELKEEFEGQLNKINKKIKSFVHMD